MEYSRKLEIEKSLKHRKNSNYLKHKIKCQILNAIGYQEIEYYNSSFIAKKVNKIVDDIVSETNDNMRLFFEYKFKDNGYDLLRKAKNLHYSLERFIKTFENISDKATARILNENENEFEWGDLIEFEEKLTDCEIEINSFLRAKELFEINNLIYKKFYNNTYIEEAWDTEENWDTEEEIPL